MATGNAKAPDPADGVDTVRAGPHRIYPLVLCRLGGQPFSCLEALRCPATSARQLLHAGLEAELEDARHRLGESLHEAVGATEGKEEPAVLLRAARNLRRSHKLSTAQEAALLTTGRPSLVSAVQHWRRQHGRVAECWQELEDAYARERSESRRQLHSLVQEASFQRGLALSSPTLYRSLERRRGRIEKTLPRAQRRLEISLLKYLTRAAAKSTPFSTFTSIVPAGLIGPADPPASPAGERGMARPIRLPEGVTPASSVVLNKALYSLLYRLLKATTELYPCFLVTLNPSLHRVADGYAMLAARNGQEQLVTLPATGALERSVELILSSGGTVPYRELAHRLGETFGAGPEVMCPRLNRMLEAGFLQLNSAIADSEQNWANLLQARLAGSPHPTARRVCRLLEEGQEVVEEFGSSSGAERSALLTSLSERIEALLAESGLLPDSVAEGPASPKPTSTPAEGEPEALVRQLRALRRNPLYEDASLAAEVQLSRPLLQPALRRLGEWVDWMSRLSGRLAWHANLRALFERHFGAAEEVPFLIFYREFFSHVFEDVLRFERGIKDGDLADVVNPFGLEVLPQIRAASQRFASTLEELWAQGPRAETLVLKRHHLPVPRQPPFAVQGALSAMVFAQIVPACPPTGKVALLVDKQTVHGGMGRYFSRFLASLAPRFTSQLRRHNTRHSGCIVAELCDDSEFSFNANLHPPLTDADINYPANLTGLDPRRNLALADLSVRRHETDLHPLRLIHRPSGREVWPVDLGFLSSMRRPPLFRVLALFSPVLPHQLNLPSSPSGAESTSDEGVTYRPRVVYEDRLVVSRKCWRVAPGVLARLIANANPVQAFTRLNRWRRDLGMPDDVFFSLSPSPLQAPHPAPPADGAAGTQKAASGSAPDAPAADHKPRHPRGRSQKPQYLNFESALLVELLCEAVRGDGGGVVFEEMLPSPDALAKRGGRPYVTEFIFQLDREPRSCG